MLKQRNSNIEILRIVAMIGIILQHCVAHNTVDYKLAYRTNVFGGVILEWSMLGRLGVAIFVIIFGFFTIKHSFRICRCFILCVEVWTYSIITYVVLLSCGYISFNSNDLIKAVFPLMYKKYWFISAYLVFYFFTPFINKILNSISQKQFKYLISIQLILWCIIRTLSFNDILIFCHELEEFMLLYCIGAYLRLWTSNEAKDQKVFKRMLYIGILLYLISPIIINCVSYYISFFTDLGNAFYYRTSIPTVLIAYGLVGIMKSRCVRSNKITNYIAGTTFGIYLFHFSVIDVLLNKFFPIDPYISHPFKLIAYLFVLTLVIFLSSFFVEFIRKQIEKLYLPFFENKSMVLQQRIDVYLP